MSKKEDKAVLKFVQERKKVSSIVIKECLDLQSQLDKANENSRLLGIFLNKNLISSEEARIIEKRAKGIKNQIIGDYKLLKKLGAGGMGAVYLAQHIKSEEEFALKIIDRKQHEKSLDRFKQEFEALKKLKHPCITKFIDAGETAKHSYYVMEFFEGESLKSFAKKQEGAVDFQLALKIVLQISEALNYALKKGMIHRDIKPDNIMLTKTSNEEYLARLVDFGLVKMMEGEDLGLTQTHSAMGTPHFISVEQAKNAKGADHRSDIYSLGATLYYLVTGRYPVEGNTAIEILSNLISEEIVPANKVNSLVPDNLQFLITKMMMKDLSFRYQDYDLLIHDIKACLSGNDLIDPLVSEAPNSDNETATVVVSNLSQKKSTLEKKLFMGGGLGFILALYLLWPSKEKTERIEVRHPDDKKDLDYTFKEVKKPFKNVVVDEKPLTESEKSSKADTQEKLLIDSPPESQIKYLRIKAFFDRPFKRRQANSILKNGKRDHAVQLDFLLAWLSKQKLSEKDEFKFYLLAKAKRILAFTGSGMSPLSGNYSEFLSKEADELISYLLPDGTFHGEASVNAICALAILEIYELYAGEKKEWSPLMKRIKKSFIPTLGMKGKAVHSKDCFQSPHWSYLTLYEFLKAGMINKKEMENILRNTQWHRRIELSSILSNGLDSSVTRMNAVLSYVFRKPNESSGNDILSFASKSCVAPNLAINTYLLTMLSCLGEKYHFKRNDKSALFALSKALSRNDGILQNEFKEAPPSSGLVISNSLAALSITNIYRNDFRTWHEILEKIRLQPFRKEGFRRNKKRKKGRFRQ